LISLINYLGVENTHSVLFRNAHLQKFQFDPEIVFTLIDNPKHIVTSHIQEAIKGLIDKDIITYSEDGFYSTTEKYTKISGFHYEK